MSFYGVWETWKIVYMPKNSTGGMRGAAFAEAGDRAHAMQIFREQYNGQFFTVKSIRKANKGVWEIREGNRLTRG